MRYEKPNMFLLDLEVNDIVTTSDGTSLGWNEEGGNTDGENFPF